MVLTLLEGSEGEEVVQRWGSRSRLSKNIEQIWEKYFDQLNENYSDKGRIDSNQIFQPHFWITRDMLNKIA